MTTTDTSGGTAMATVLDAILNRVSVTQVAPERPPRALIERLLETAVMAPNHHLNEPWRFVVLAGTAREELGEVLARRSARLAAEPHGPAALAQQDAERRKPLRAPVLIVAAAEHGGHPHALEVEDVASVAAAAEHVLLAAPALGLGAFWRTGDAAYDDEVKAFLGLRPTHQVVALLYVGYPIATRAPKPRAAVADKTTWRGWEA